MNALPLQPPAAEAAPLSAAELAELFPARRVPTRPVLIPTLPEAPVVYRSLAHLADELARRLNGRVPVLIRGQATYPGYDTFPVFSVHAMSPIGLQGRPRAATYLCAVGVQEVSAEDLDRAIADAMVRQIGSAA